MMNEHSIVTKLITPKDTFAEQWLSDYIYSFRYDPDTNGIYFTDSYGFIASSEEIDIDNLSQYIKRFFNHYDDNAIEQYNDSMYQRKSQKPNKKKKEKPKKLEYIYLIYSDSGHYKIGISKSPQDRKKQLAGTIGPYDLHLIKEIQTYDAKDIEADLHSMFDEFRVQGEWFEFEENVLEEVLEQFDVLEDVSNE